MFRESGVGGEGEGGSEIIEDVQHAELLQAGRGGGVQKRRGGGGDKKNRRRCFKEGQEECQMKHRRRNLDRRVAAGPPRPGLNELTRQSQRPPPVVFVVVSRTPPRPPFKPQLKLKHRVPLRAHLCALLHMRRAHGDLLLRQVGQDVQHGGVCAGCARGVQGGTDADHHARLAQMVRAADDLQGGWRGS